MRASNVPFLAATLATTAACFASAQQAAMSGMTAASHCEGNTFCVTSVYSPSSRSSNYTLVVNNADQPFGWVGIGIGSRMAGANYVITWLNGDGTLTTSQRGASGEVQPQESLAPAARYTRNEGVTAKRGSQAIFSWTMPMDQAPGASQAHIYGVAGTGKTPTSAASSATIRQHDDYGRFSLDMTAAYDGSAPAGLAGAASTTGSTGLAAEEGGEDINTHYNRLIVAHMTFMLAAWLVLVPAAVLIARFGRTFFTWFPAHRGIQLVTVAFVIIAFALAVAAVQSEGRGASAHFSNRHERIGIFLFLLVLVQAALGQAQHVIFHRTGKRVGGYVHAAIGVGSFILAVYNLGQGFEFWDYETPSWRAIPIYVWAGVVGAVYIAGFALIPRERRQQRELEGKRSPSASEKNLAAGTP